MEKIAGFFFFNFNVVKSKNFDVNWKLESDWFENS